MINPKIQEMAEKAFKEAFEKAFDIKNRKHHRLMLAYAAMLEMGADYVRLRAFERMFQHLIELKEIDGKEVEKLKAEAKESVKGESSD